MELISPAAQRPDAAEADWLRQQARVLMHSNQISAQVYSVLLTRLKKVKEEAPR